MPATTQINSNSRFDFQLDTINTIKRQKKLPATKTTLSFVIPVRNAESTLGELVNSIKDSVDTDDVEIILLDDKSSDDSWRVIEKLADLYPEQVRGLRFRHRSGRSASLQAGFDAAKGEIVITMEANLLDDPREIPRMINRLEEGYDVVSAWKVSSDDPVKKLLPDYVFPKVMRHLKNSKIEDRESMFRCYRKKVVKSIMALDDHHSMLPKMAEMLGFEVTELVVEMDPSQLVTSRIPERTLAERLERTFEIIHKLPETPEFLTRISAVTYLMAALLAGLFSMIVGAATFPGTLLCIGACVIAGTGFIVATLGLLCQYSPRENYFRTAGIIASDTKKSRQRPQIVEFDQHERRYIVNKIPTILKS